MKIMARRVSAGCILIIVALFLPAFLSATTGPRNLSFGVYGGWSLGAGERYGQHSSSVVYDDIKLDLHVGAYIQYNLSAFFSIQGNISYQHGKNVWPEVAYGEEAQNFGFVSLNLNALLNDRRWGAVQPYLLGGCGITSFAGLGGTDYEDLETVNTFQKTYFNLTAGLGLKIYLSESHPSLALNLGGAYFHLISLEEYGGASPDYFRFQIGIEF